MSNLNPAIDAAAAALCDMLHDDGEGGCQTHGEATGPDARWCAIGEDDARKAVEAAAPLIRQAVSDLWSRWIRALDTAGLIQEHHARRHVVTAHKVTRTVRPGGMTVACTCGDGWESSADSMSDIPAAVLAARWEQAHARKHPVTR